MSEQVTRAIVLMNLGSPDTTAVKDVRKYLNEFLMDERVIDYPFLPRLLLVKGIISPLRAPRSAKAYSSVWTKDGSPLIALTKQLQQALQQKTDIPVAIAMRYGSYPPEEAYKQLHAQYPNLKEIILLPLYPHYAMSSYETAVLYAQEQHAAGNYASELVTIQPYYNEPRYLKALSDSIAPYLKGDYDKILFSYHGLPHRHILKGDITGSHCYKAENCCTTPSSAHKFCYKHQCTVTSLKVAELLQIPKEKYGISFQSRLGRAQWVEPYTVTLLKELPQQGVKNLVVVCPAFVSDCLETLEEMAMEGRELFLESGGTSFTLVPCMNTQDAWVSTIASWITDIEKGNRTMLADNAIAYV
jgi:ferrochelatase